MKIFIYAIRKDKILLIPLGILLATVLTFLIGGPITSAQHNSRVEQCAGQGGVLIKEGVCLDRDAVIQLTQKP